MTDTPARPTVALCMTTFMRPVGLARLLDAVGRLDTSAVDGVTLIVVDNDPAGSAATVVDAARSHLDHPVVYEVEPRRGVTHVRNRALDLAKRSGAEWIGWLDDDEAPRADWLTRLFATQATTGADVVSGPPHPIYEPEAPQWIIDAGAFEPEHFPTGESYPFFHTRTSGVIMRAAAVPPEGFDNRLALTGGEDRVFFTRIHRAGGRFVWDDDAVVDEWVPTARVSLRWLTRRWFRIGVTRSLTLLYLDDPSVMRRSRRVLGGVAMAARGVVGTLLALPRGRSRALAASRLVLLGFGASWGALGRHLHEYRTTQGA